MSCFTEEERTILDIVLSKFKNTSASEISELSHNENAWGNYYNTNQMINYNEAFILKALDNIP